MILCFTSMSKKIFIFFLIFRFLKGFVRLWVKEKRERKITLNQPLLLSSLSAALRMEDGDNDWLNTLFHGEGNIKQEFYFHINHFTILQKRYSYATI